MRTNGFWVSRARRAGALLSASLIWLAAPLSASAATAFDDIGLFSEAAGPTTLYDFETDSGFPAADGTVLGTFDGIDFNGQLFATTSLPPGAQTFTGAGGTFTTATIGFPGDVVTAIGFIGGDLTVGEIIEVTATFASGAVGVYDVTLLAGTPAFTPTFFGLVSEDDPIAGLSIRGTDGGGGARAWFIDDLQVATFETPPAWNPNDVLTQARLSWNQNFGRTDDFSVSIRNYEQLTPGRTTILLEEPRTAAGITEILVIWDAVTDGQTTITEDDLTYLQLDFLANGNLVYRDVAIVAREVQPINGVPRPAADVLFEYDPDSEVIVALRNVFGSTVAGAVGSGLLYELADNTTIPIDGITIVGWDNGDQLGFPETDQVASQGTGIAPFQAAFWFSDELITVDANTQYTASVWSLTDTAGANNAPSFRFFDAQGNQLAGQLQPASGLPSDPTDVWVQKTVTFFPPAGATGMRVFLEPTVEELGAGIGGTVTFDDLNIQTIDGSTPVGPNLGPNPDFDTVIEITTDVEAGTNITVVSRAENPASLIEATAERVIEAGTTNFLFCRAPDPRELPTGYVPRTLVLSELSFTGTCGDLSSIDLELTPATRGFPDENGVVNLVIAIVTTDALFEGLIVEEQFPEDLTGLLPSCDVPLSERPFKVAAPLSSSPFNEPPIPEGKTLVRDTAICNRPRSFSYRYSGHVFFVRNDETLLSSQQLVSQRVAGLFGTIRLGTCVDSSLRYTLVREAYRARLDVSRAQYSSAVARLENIARLVQNNPAAFAACPVDANYLGFLKSRALVAAGEIFDRLLNPDPASREIYQVPSDITVPGATPPPVIP